MAEDSDKNPGKIIKDQGRANKEQHQKEMSELAKQSKDISRQNTIAEVNKGILEGMAKAEDLRGIGQDKLANESIDALQTLQQSLLNNQNANAVAAREADLKNIQESMAVNDEQLTELSEKQEAAQERAFDKQFKQRKRVEEALEKRKKDREAKAQEENLSGLEKLSENMKLNTKANELSDGFIEKALLDMGPNFAGEIDPVFNELQDELKKVQDLEAQGLVSQKESNEIRQAILDATTDREKEREAQEAAELQAMALTQLGDKFARVGEKIGDVGKSAVKGAGLLGGLIALVMGVVDPQLFAETVTKLMTGFTEIIGGILAFFKGDFETSKKLIGDNLLLFGGIILGLALYFGGPLIAAFGGIFTKLAKVVKAVKVFRLFMMGPFLTGMTGLFTGIMGAITPIFAALAPILLPILAIAAIFGLIYVGLNKMKEALGFTSIFDVLMLGLAHMKDAFGHIVNTIGGIVNFIMGIVEKFGRFLGFDIDIPEIPEMEVNNAAKKKVELKAKAEAKAAEEAAAAANKVAEEVVLNNPTTGTDLQAGAAQIDANAIALAAGGGQTVNAPSITSQTSAVTNTTTSINYSGPSDAILQQAQFYGRA